MSLFRRLASFGSPSSSTSVSSGGESDRQFDTVTPDDGIKTLKEHCRSIHDIILTSETSKGSLETSRRVLDHFNGVINTISDEKCRDGQLGPCLEYAMESGVFEEIFSWSLGQRACMKELIKEQLKLYKSLIKRCKQPILILEEIVVPLKRLLRSCTGKQSSDIELVFVDVLHQLCVCVNQDVSLLNAHFINASSPKEGDLSVFSLLIPYLHSEGEVGSRSRDAVLLCTSLSMFQEQLANFICEETTFCPVLATGLSALYSRLPNTLDVPGEDWYTLEKGLWTTLPELKSFITSLEFCNDVIQTAHPRIQSKLLDLIYQGFLVSVMAPALNQNSTDALIAATAYFDLFLGSVTEPKLMKVFLKFILREKFDEVQILHSLLQRIDTKNELCLVTMALFQTLVNLNSEDVMIELVLKYLLPCNHVMGSQRKMIQEMDLYGKVAVRFLTLIPSCCFPDVHSESILAETSQVDNGKEDEDQTSSTPEEPLTLSSDFLTYLLDVRKTLSDRRVACSCWSALWDGLDPTYVSCAADIKSGKTTLSNGSALHISSSSPEMSQLCSEEEKPVLRRSLSGDTDNLELLLGPFITKLFQKLEKMPDNSIAVNQVLTGIISSLAEYPQPLLRSFLLNHSLVLQPDVKSIFQILNSVKAKVEACLSQLDNLEHPLLVAKQNLIDREEMRKRSASRRLSQQSSPKIAREHTALQRRVSDSPARSLPDVTSPTRNTFVEAKLSMEPGEMSGDKDLENAIEQSSSWILLNLGPKGISRERTRSKHINIMKNTIYCAVLMEEWMKELAAISLEHVIQPYPEVEVMCE